MAGICARCVRLRPQKLSDDPDQHRHGTSHPSHFCWKRVLTQKVVRHSESAEHRVPQNLVWSSTACWLEPPPGRPHSCPHAEGQMQLPQRAECSSLSALSPISKTPSSSYPSHPLVILAGHAPLAVRGSAKHELRACAIFGPRVQRSTPLLGPLAIGTMPNHTRGRTCAGTLGRPDGRQ